MACWKSCRLLNDRTSGLHDRIDGYDVTVTSLCHCYTGSQCYYRNFCSLQLTLQLGQQTPWFHLWFVALRNYISHSSLIWKQEKVYLTNIRDTPLCTAAYWSAFKLGLGILTRYVCVNWWIHYRRQLFVSHSRSFYYFYCKRMLLTGFYFEKAHRERA